MLNPTVEQLSFSELKDIIDFAEENKTLKGDDGHEYDNPLYLELLPMLRDEMQTRLNRLLLETRRKRKY